MRVLLIEDEQPAARRLSKLLTELEPSIQILDVIDSVEAAVKWLNTFREPDLLFMDIQLADGISFDIFRQVELKIPVIFTTAYDEYTLKAFKVNSVDYLLKPIDKEELTIAIQKFKDLHKSASIHLPNLEKLLQNISSSTYKERLLVKTGQHLTYLNINELAYCFSEGSVTFALSQTGKKWVLDYPIDQLIAMLNPKEFFRISRKLVVNIKAIQKIHPYFNSRLKLDLQPATSFEVIVSRERVSDFKEWLEQ